ncbi:response regulator transcription factor [Streptomyces mirabilis]|uniref:response regulator transcription factor n=1 Tax=Streptomyces mirabilis TaxID=68239 RepID=UPI003648EC72
MAPEPRPAFGWRALTPVERQVARHAAEGRTNRAAAVELDLSPNTAATHLRATIASSASISGWNSPSQYGKRSWTATSDPAGTPSAGLPLCQNST